MLGMYTRFDIRRDKIVTEAWRRWQAELTDEKIFTRSGWVSGDALPIGADQAKEMLKTVKNAVNNAFIDDDMTDDEWLNATLALLQ